MNKYLFLISVLILSSNIHAQESMNPYLNYHTHINSAELHIVDGDEKLAINEYKTAFLIDSIVPLAKDYYNASICAIKSKKYDFAFDWCKTLVKSGLSKAFFEKNELFKPITDKKKWKELLEYKISDFNQNLIDTLNNLYVQDQYYRAKIGSYKVYGDSIKMIDKNNDRILLDIIKRYGYPSEKLLGLSEGIGFEKKFEMVIWHQTTLNRISDYTQILISAAKNGLISPQRAGSLIENHTGLSLYNMEPYYRVICSTCSDSIQSDVANKIFYWDMPGEKVAKYDSLRSEIGLESLQDYNKKILYVIKNKPPYIFYGQKASPNFIFRSDKDVIEFKKGEKYIEL